MITARLNNFILVSVFYYLSIYRLSEKMFTFNHVVYCFWGKTKISLGA